MKTTNKPCATDQGVGGRSTQGTAEAMQIAASLLMKENALLANRAAIPATRATSRPCGPLYRAAKMAEETQALIDSCTPKSTTPSITGKRRAAGISCGALHDGLWRQPASCR